MPGIERARQLPEQTYRLKDAVAAECLETWLGPKGEGRDAIRRFSSAVLDKLPEATDEIERLRPQSRPLNSFKFGAQIIKTKVNMMVPARSTVEHLDVVAALYEPTVGNQLEDSLSLDEIDIAGMESESGKP